MNKKEFEKFQKEIRLKANELAQKLAISTANFCQERDQGPSIAVTALFAAALYLIDTQIIEEDDSEEEIDDKIGVYLDDAQELNENYMFKEDPCKGCTLECSLKKPERIN
jgi:hypothetical protein